VAFSGRSSNRAKPLQEAQEQSAYLLRLLLLHPVVCSLNEMAPEHGRAGICPHLLKGTRLLVIAPVRAPEMKQEGTSIVQPA
jgi:hypothetical protein